MAKSAFYRVWNDKKVDITDMVTDLSIEESDSESDLIGFTINDTRIEIMDEDWLCDGKHVHVLFGYIGGEVSKKRTGKIKSIDYSYGGANSIMVEATDLGDLNQTSNAVYKKKTISQIVTEVAKGAALKTSIDATSKVYESLPQGNKTYTQFLKELAAMAGSDEKAGSYFCTVTGDTLTFKKRDLAKKPVLKINRSEKISFRVSQDSTKAIESLSASSIDTETNEVVTVKVDSAKDQETALGKYIYNANGNVINKKNDSGRNVVLPSENKEDTKKQLAAKVKDSQLEATTGTMIMEGTFTVNPGDIVTLVEFARKHSGNWKVEKVRYSFSGGFQVELTLKKNASDVKGAAVNSTAKDKNTKVGAAKGQEKTEVKTVKYNANGVKL